MRVSVVCGRLPRRAEPAGVAATMIAGQLARFGHATTIVTRLESAPGRGLRRDPLVRVRQGVSGWGWAGLPSLYRELKRSRPDAVLLLYRAASFDHHPMITYLPTLCRWLSPAPRVVVELADADGAGAEGASVALGRAVARLFAGALATDARLGTLLRDADTVGVYAPEHVEWLAKAHPAAAGKIAHIPGNGPLPVVADPDGAMRRAARFRLGAAEEHFVLAFAGDLRPGAGIETVLQAVAIARSRVPEIRLLMPADLPTPYAQHVRREAVTLGVSDCITWANAGDDDGTAGLRAADACVVPGARAADETDALARATAACFGLPLIAPRAAGAPAAGAGAATAAARRDFVHRRDAMLFRPFDSADLAAVIIELAGSPRLREALCAGSLSLARAAGDWDAGMRQRRLLLAPGENLDRPLPSPLPRPRVPGIPPYANARRVPVRS